MNIHWVKIRHQPRLVLMRVLDIGPQTLRLVDVNPAFPSGKAGTYKIEDVEYVRQPTDAEMKGAGAV